MPELQDKFVNVLKRVANGQVETRNRWPVWIQRPGRIECGALWKCICDIYSELTGGLNLPDVMPLKESRSLDAVLLGSDGRHRLVEFDESQHFNKYRQMTFRYYPEGINLAFPVSQWASQCVRMVRLPGGGFAKPRPPLFPMEGGRHRQRAFRDALADVLPVLHGFAPTLRIADFELEAWIDESDANSRLSALLNERLDKSYNCGHNTIGSNV
jgi:hypothetical protein